MKLFFTVFILFTLCRVVAQQADTSGTLESIIIKAYEQNRKIKDVPAAVNFLDRQALERFGSGSIVHAINTTPGVKMEERSQGSYRVNIRGSSLRSPFGVRNVKVYYNDIPFTDPSGQTYFNNLGYYNFSSVEILKGPGSSLYGAGTGGVLIIETTDVNERPNAFAEYTSGSYGMRNIYASVTTGNDESKNKIGFQHQESEGYRYHSALERNIFSWNGKFKTSDDAILKTSFLYSHVFYETPGGLTKNEYDNNPKLARPAGGGFPGAEQARASISQKMFLSGISYTHQIFNGFSNSTSLYGMFTELRNPAIRNFGKNEEPHLGGRTNFSYDKQLKVGRINLIAGAEVQHGFASIFAFQNRNGVPDTLQSLDEIRTKQSLAFFQASFEKKGWELSAGGSINLLSLSFKRSAPAPLQQQERNFNNEFAPRLALAKKFQLLTIYSSVSRGFSPPTTAELLPSGSAINLSLNAETGINYDLGFRGNLKDLSFDMNAFIFSLQNTIVQRRDAGGGDFFINAGKTKQRGIETSLHYPLLNFVPFIRQSKIWFNHTWHHFLYNNFKQLVTDFTGNLLPGTAAHTVSTGIDIATKKGFSGNVNFYYSDKIPLNDANTAYAPAYHLLHAKLGFEKLIAARLKIRWSIGAENLLNETYSLGNDINAFGGRFYNAAPGRSFYTTFTMQLFYKKTGQLL